MLYEREKGAMRLQATDAAAERAGLYRSQNLSDARALCPGLVAREMDGEYLSALFGSLADWHAYASPIVSIFPGTFIPDIRTSFGDLLLDVTGVSHLFGGNRQMLAHVSGRLERAGFTAQGAMAQSIGGAWALARFDPGKIVEAEDLKTCLAPLPVSALRLDEKLVFGLEQMGLKTIGSLYGRNRKALRARFGDRLIERLNQALGYLEERLVPRLPVPERQSERRLAEPIVLERDILMVVNDLAIRLCAQLEKEGMGAQSFHLLLFRIDCQLMYLAVNAARPVRAPDHIARLFVNRIKRLAGEFDAGFGIEAIRLTAGSVSQLDAHQSGVFELVDGAKDLERLYDRMAARLGPKAILRSRPVNSHLPERAVVLEPVIAGTGDDADALISFEDGEPATKAALALPARPLRLLPVPEQISVMAEVPDGPPVRMVWRRLSYRLLKAAGPERIGVEWWQPGAGTLTRDYYRVEDKAGRRFWIFREGLYGSESNDPRWFMHGFDP
ncbi:MAG TPA: DNA polymerase Y family protein [Devosia sp.]|nr:DNA polymerase Y family protein [Devosia sp.]